MPLELSHLMQLAARQRTELHVGDLPRPIAEYLGCHPAIVWLGANEMQKIFYKHKEIEVFEFQNMSLMIRNGEYYKDDARANCVTVVYKCNICNLPYLAGLKAVGTGEVWVQTHHRFDMTKWARKKARWEMLLPHRE